MIIYRDFKMSSLETSSSKLFSKVDSQKNSEYETFEKNLVGTLNNQAPKKTKLFRGKQKLHINKILRNAMMKRSK